jgi:hypothetical protein
LHRRLSPAHLSVVESSRMLNFQFTRARCQVDRESGRSTGKDGRHQRDDHLDLSHNHTFSLHPQLAIQRHLRIILLTYNLASLNWSWCQRMCGGGGGIERSARVTLTLAVFVSRSLYSVFSRVRFLHFHACWWIAVLLLDLINPYPYYMVNCVNSSQVDRNRNQGENFGSFPLKDPVDAYRLEYQ